MKKILFISVVLCALVVLVKCEKPKHEKQTEDTPKGSKVTSTSPNHIRIGIAPYIIYAPCYVPYVVALEKGFYSELGLDVELVDIPTAVGRRYAISYGNIDFVTLDTGDIGILVALGHPVSLVLESVWGLKTDKIIIKNKYKSINELKGKTLACDKSFYSGYFFFIKTLEKYGLSTKDVKIINMTEKEAFLAFYKNEVDAIKLPRNLALKAVDTCNGKIAIEQEEIDKDPLGIYVRNEILQKQPDIVVKVLKAYFMALRFSKEHHKEYYEIANQKLFNNAYEYEQFKTLEQAIKFLTPEEIKTEMKTDGPLFQLCEQVVDFYYNQGKIKTKPEPASFIDNKLYIQALDSYLEKEK